MAFIESLDLGYWQRTVWRTEGKTWFTAL